MGEARDPDRRLEARLRALEAENARLRRALFAPDGGPAVRVPESMRPLFEQAQERVGSYFRDFRADPSRGTIEIAGERYLLVRAAGLSYGFVRAVQKLYADRGDAEALRVGRTLLFDMAHVIGAADARNFIRKMAIDDPLTRLSAGPVHFAYTGWAFVDILEESRPVPNDDYYLKFHHPFSFEADSWMRAGKKPDYPVCFMSAGYAAGWCQESFGLPLSATEIACRARGDEHCTFVMAPPHRLRGYVSRELADVGDEERYRAVHEIPTLFERKEAEERLLEALRRAEAANEAKSRFLANMSHEIRTPLTGILGMATLLEREDLAHAQREKVEGIDQSGQALLSVLNDILDAAKIDAGMMTVSRGPCDVRALLREVELMQAGRVVEKGLRYETTVDASVPARVESDPVRLRQVVLNLVSNALKFTTAGHVVVRASWTAPGTLAIEVEDTGVGMEPSQIERLFEAFTQADTSPSREHAGTGLGLTLAREFARLLGGDLEARSAPGEGTTFRLQVLAPALDAPDVHERPAKAEAPPRFDGSRLLLVEDDRIARYVVRHLLEGLGCEVTTASDGAQAVEAAAQASFDLVLMDCQMPRMDGYEATRRIRHAEGDGRRTPIVALTASVLREDTDRTRDAGMDDFLPKPVDPDHLAAVLTRWIRPDAAR